MVEDQVVSLVTNLTAAGVTTATSVSAGRVQNILRRQRYSEEVEAVATEFTQALESAIKDENARRDTKELNGVVDNWSDVAVRLAKGSDSTHELSPREKDQVSLLFEDEETAVRRIADAIAATEGYDLEQTPQLRQALEAALTRAYRQAIADFEQRIAGTDLADVFETETGLVLSEKLDDLRNQLAELGATIESLLSQPAREEGFQQLTPSGFAYGPDPRPERCWRIGFTLADVHAGLPAERLGKNGTKPASQELFEALQSGEDHFVVGGPGSGKSTLCKQVAIRWYESQSTGPVLYRESGSGGGTQFESVEALKQAILASDEHTLVVVEDAVQPGASAVFEVVEKLSGYEQVSFLFDDLRTAVEDFDGTGPVESSVRPRQSNLVESLHRYHLPRLSKTDIERVIAGFEAATGRTVDHDADSLRNEIRSRSNAEIGDMMLLSFLLPVTGGDGDTGLERNVRNRYETLDPDSETAIRDLSRFDPELVADVGVMLTLLNASGIGIKPELVHALGYEYGHDWETHDEIAEIRAALEGWFLYAVETDDTDGIIRTTHRLWSTLYLRRLAFDHEVNQRDSRRRERSDRRFARCLTSLFALFDDAEHREELSLEFPDSELINRINDQPDVVVTEFLNMIFEMGENWPALASLFGVTRTAIYDFPDMCPDESRCRALELRGHTHRLRGNYEKSRYEYERTLELATEHGNKHAVARSYNHLGLVAEASGDTETARDRFQESLECFRELGDRRGEAMCFSNLGLVARKEGDLTTAQEYLERSLRLFRDVAGGHIEAVCLGNLGIIAQNSGDLPLARKYLRRSFEITRNMNDRRGKAQALIGLGLVSRNEGNHETASEFIDRSIKIERELGYREGWAKALGVKALIARDQEDFNTARESYERSLDIFQEISDEYGEATILGGLAIMVRAQGEYQKAQEKLERSQNIFSKFEDEHAAAESAGLLGAVQVANGNEESGRHKLNDAYAELAAIGAPLTMIRVFRHHIEAELERENIDHIQRLYDEAKACATEAESDLGYEWELIKSHYQSVAQ
ncbi:tetratricopeptide repeat protein [Natronorubrum sp. JWXQ-INN-674]|uniref:Tetratricopeptide repeat protein n=1 Tax=Natronorubrum halalkaliphilum TaxID=2691917 RepID=A0A6B0VLJ4_9EURY|nr:tetratricopeptide repeat protein [Natronorubrum halalkaliphilum]MXV61876.1 tetratricopeptide repeat protein [Natronorubrum halalkaliphilum]